MREITVQFLARQLESFGGAARDDDVGSPRNGPSRELSSETGGRTGDENSAPLEGVGGNHDVGSLPRRRATAFGA